MSADQSTYQGQHIMEVELVEDAEDTNARRREFEDHESATGNENPESFAERIIEARHVPDSECDDRTRELSWRNGKLDGVSGDRGDPRAADLRRAGAEHRLGEISAHHQSSK